MAMEAKYWSDQQKFHVVYDDYVHAATAEQALAIALVAITEDETVWDTFAKATPAEPSSPEPSGEAAVSELSYDLDAAHRLYCDVKNTDSNPEYARCLERLGELLRIEAAYKRGGGK